MFISTVFSYQDGWNILQRDAESTLDDINYALKMFDVDNLSKKHVTRAFRGNSDTQPVFSASLPLALSYYLKKKNWIELAESKEHKEFRSFGLKHLAFKGNTSIKLISTQKKPLFSNWLVYETPLIFCSGVSSVSVLLVPEKDVSSILEDKNKRDIFTLDKCRTLLRKLSPLKSNAPFVILGFSSQKQLFDPDIYDIRPSENSLYSNSLSVTRSLEFSEEYFESGVRIISEFCKYLREKHPNEDVKVKIEQRGLQVNLVVETFDGDPVRITRMLNDYTDDLEKSGVSASSSDINLTEELLKTLQMSLQRNPSQNVQVTTSSESSSESYIQINQNISAAIGSINEILDQPKLDNQEKEKLETLVSSLDELENEKQPEKIRKSGAMNRFKRIVEGLNDSNDTLRKALESLNSGMTLATDLCKKYNNLAEWCGLPQVPKFFLSESPNKQS